MRNTTFYCCTMLALSGTLGLIAANGASAAQLGAFDQSASYNSPYEMKAGQENQSISGGTRDANGNRVIVNGMLGSNNVSHVDGVKTSGVGVNGANATAIGNSLNVTVQGSWNTVIVDSKQVNKGNQNANVDLTGQLHL